jgi:hypothetical protein
VVFSVAAERRRNLLYIEATKQEFMKDIEAIKKHCEPVSDLIVEVNLLRVVKQNGKRYLLKDRNKYSRIKTLLTR